MPIRTDSDAATGDQTEQVIPFLKSYTVFNVEQIDGLPERFQLRPAPAPIEDISRDERLEAFFKATGADIRHGGGQAFYAVDRDYVQMPPLECFVDATRYYAVLAHEMTHWTRHATRLDRSFGRKRFGDEGYAQEELVAEIGAAFACAELGITPEVREDHAAYIGSWLKVLKNDKRAIFTAASQAQRAFEFLKGSSGHVCRRRVTRPNLPELETCKVATVCKTAPGASREAAGLGDIHRIPLERPAQGPSRHAQLTRDHRLAFSARRNLSSRVRQLCIG